MSVGTQQLQPGAQAAPSMLPRVAALVVLAMALVLWVDVLFRARLVAVIGSSVYSTTAGLVISAVTLPVAVGLWLRLGWAWWVGLIAAAVLLMSYLLQAIVVIVTSGTLGAADWLIAMLLAVFLVVLLLPSTRTACLQRDAGSPQ